MSTPSDVLVVGASAAGLTVVESLRRKGYPGRITLLGEESEAPYDRPPLSKHVLAGIWDTERTRLRSHEALSSLNAEFLLGERAVSLDAAERRVYTASGTALRAEAVVLATGLHARRPPGPSGPAGAHVLRTLADAARLREALLKANRVAVIGDGVLGAEVAATTRQMGSEVTLAGPQAAPMWAQLGSHIARRLAGLHTERGVHLRPNTLVEAVEASDGRVTGIRTADSELLSADLVVSAVGGTPAVDWLRDSGLTLLDGVLCDSRCRAAEGIYAVGDVARFHHEALGRPLRLENRTNATEQAVAVAANILGEDRPYTPVPYFWTDQFEVKIQVYGLPTPTATVHVVEGAETNRFVAHYLDDDGTPIAVLGWNMPKQARQHRRHLVERYDPTGARPRTGHDELIRTIP